MIKEKSYIYIKKSWCKKCNFCIEFCPRDVIVEGEDGYPEIKDISLCKGCRLCVTLCPEFAIVTEMKVKEELERK